MLSFVIVSTFFLLIQNFTGKLKIMIKYSIHMITGYLSIIILYKIIDEASSLLISEIKIKTEEVEE